MWSTVRSPRHRNTLIFWFCTCSTFWKVNRSTFASLAMLIRNMWPRFLHRSAANVCLSWTYGSILKGKTLFWDQVHMLARSMHYEAGSPYPGHLSVIGALLLWHDAGCQLQTPFKRVSMCEIERREWRAVVKQTEAPASKVQQPPATSHSNFHSQRDWRREYTLSPSDRWLSWMPDRSLGLCDAA